MRQSQSPAGGNNQPIYPSLDILQLPASGVFNVLFTCFLKYPAPSLHLAKHTLWLSPVTIPAYNDFTLQWHLTVPPIWPLLMSLFVTLPVFFNWVVFNYSCLLSGS